MGRVLTVGYFSSYSTPPCSSSGYIWLCLCVIAIPEEKEQASQTMRKITDFHYLPAP